MTKQRKVPFHLVDVFAVEPLTGNPLAVVDGGQDLSLDVLRRIAREFNQSETTFVMPPRTPKADWLLRSFTASGAEVFGAGGHNTLGAWWWLAHSGRLELPGDVTLFQQEIGDRVLPLSIVKIGGKLENVVMDQEPPAFGEMLSRVDALAAALGLSTKDLAIDQLPSQVISTGAAHLMVPIRNRDVVDRIRPDAKLLFSVLESVGGEGCYVFSLDGRQEGVQAYARFFNPTVGIAEDPATGTAAGPLATHLVRHKLAAPGKVRIEQGTALGRTSIIQVEVAGASVKVHGRGVIVASGNLLL